MNQDHDKQDNRLVRAYERMLERLGGLTQGPQGIQLREGLDRVKQRAVELGELTREEAEHIGDYLRRDIEDAAQYVANSDKDYRTWLHMDLQLVENWIWDRFTSVADRTRVELTEFQNAADGPEEYHSGEIAAPGALTCMSCGHVLRFERTEHIPSCPQCGGNRFMRSARA